MTIRSGLALAFAAGLGFAGHAQAQDQLYRTAEAQAGKTVRLGVFGNVDKDCKPGPQPEIKVTTPPKHGTLAVRSGKTKPGSLKRCPSLEVPAQGVFYQAAPKYSGPDEVAYEVKRNGRSQAFTVRITVGDQAKPEPKGAPEGTDL